MQDGRKDAAVGRPGFTLGLGVEPEVNGAGDGAGVEGERDGLAAAGGGVGGEEGFENGAAVGARLVGDPALLEAFKEVRELLRDAIPDAGLDGNEA